MNIKNAYKRLHLYKIPHQLVNLSTYQLINSSTCQLVNSSTRKLPQYSSFFKFGFAVRSVDGIG